MKTSVQEPQRLASAAPAAPSASASLDVDRVPLPATTRRIRVLHVITRMIVGGAQENTMFTCALADRERFDCEILSGEETGREGELHGETRDRGVPLHLEASLVRAVRPVTDLVALWKLWRFLRRTGPWDVVHTHSSKAGILGRIAARLAGVPHVVHTAHGWGFTPAQPRAAFHAFVWAERLCARLADVLVVVTDEDRKDALSRGIGRPEQYRLIRSGIRVELFRDARNTTEDARALLGLPRDAFVVGSVGRLTVQKAPLDLLEGFAVLARERPDARLVYVGEGPLRAEIAARAESLGLAGRVLLAGLRRDVPLVMRAFDVFALASRWEGLPRVFPQAMAAALPIVATRVDGAADAVRDGETGLLVEVGDVGELGRALLELAEDRARCLRMGEAARASVDAFSVTRMVRHLEALYSELVLGRQFATRTQSRPMSTR
jgi:glycosyltransferase involved in cell wall biosynthesis